IPFVPPTWQRGVHLLVVLVVLFIAVAAGAWPVVRHLTRRLQALKQGVETFGRGQLDRRVEISGHDEVAAVARSFNQAAERVEAQPTPAHAVLRVCDRGPGVPAALRERIFEPFYRLPGHAEKAGGVGLGLSLVKQIAGRHGGSAHCEAREGGGSCFVLSLPL